mmetsp:Transcript_66091/g.171925  ORF Transcript_66091/g.171925 Transcript_66091/m.171925 type:complete len:92 (+) Transcript_66091:378-653(+)
MRNRFSKYTSPVATRTYPVRAANRDVSVAQQVWVVLDSSTIAHGQVNNRKRTHHTAMLGRVTVTKEEVQSEATIVSLPELTILSLSSGLSS